LTNGIVIPKYLGQPEDDWLALLSSYLINRFSADKEPVDVRKVVGKDLQFERVMELSRTSQIKQMMNKNILIE
jgi:hypothetical protein